MRLSSDDSHFEPADDGEDPVDDLLPELPECQTRHEPEQWLDATHRVWLVRPCGHDCTVRDVCASCVAELVGHAQAPEAVRCGRCTEWGFARLLHVEPLVLL